MTNRSFELPVDVAGIARDATYVAVGAGVLAFQRLQVARRDLASQLEDASSTSSTVVALIGDQLRLVEERVTALGEQVGTQVTALGEQVGTQVTALRNRVTAQLS